MQRRNKSYSILIGIVYVSMACIFSACSATKFLKDGESFYTGSTIDLKTTEKVGRKSAIKTDLETYITPQPNKKFLGNRIGVWFYYVAGTPKKKKGFRNFVKNKLGTPPVLMDQVDPNRIALLLSGRLNNEGYFKSTTAASVKTKKKETEVTYTVQLKAPYHLNQIAYPQGRDSIYAMVFRTMEKGSLLKPKQRYQLDLLQAEQKRIEGVVENYGFYYFDDQYLIFEADSTIGNKNIDLQLRLEEGVPARAKKMYDLHNVTVYPNYTLQWDTVHKKMDTTWVKNMRFIDDAGFFKPNVLERFINLKSGARYRKIDQEYTLSHLMSLGTFKFVNIKLRADTSKTHNYLHADIFLTPLKKKSLKLDAQVVSKSNNFVGPGIGFTFTNRNFLKGAELFQFKLNSSYEVQLNNTRNQTLNSFELGAEAKLSLPRFITPFNIDFTSRKYIPHTSFKLGSNLQNRVGYFRLNSFQIGYGYNWRETTHSAHELYPIEVNYIKTDKTSREFLELLNYNVALRNSFDNQFIIGTRYSYTINTQLKEEIVNRVVQNRIRTHNFYFNGNVDIAGNLMNTLQGWFSSQEVGNRTILNQPYSQYIRGDVDLRHYWQTSKTHRVVSRVVLASGYALGNSKLLPYIKQFAIGGSNSIRAFQPRSIGPGTYNILEDSLYKSGNIFVDQRGDIKLEMNVEFRFDVYKAVKGAVFIDAGNIWLFREDAYRPGGVFAFDRFFNELAVGTGFGLRFDFSFFVLRGDLAMPIRKPYLPIQDRWVFDEIDFGSSSWRRNNLVFNIAIGYPF
jgi:outer membrane protein insertion porin family